MNLTIMQSLRFHVKSWLPARSIVMECLSARWDIDPSGEIMVLNRFCPVSMRMITFILAHGLSFYPALKLVNALVYILIQYFFQLMEYLTHLYNVLQWKLHLFELEEEMKIDPPIKYVLYEVIEINVFICKYFFVKPFCFFHQ